MDYFDYWFNCNVCHTQNRSRLKFDLTSCGHIFCENCINPSYCFICQQPCSSFRLSNEMSGEYNIYFSAVPEILRVHQNEITELQNKKLNLSIKVIEFQDRHRKLLHTHLLSYAKKNQELMEKNKELESRLAYLEKENERLKSKSQTNLQFFPGNVKTQPFDFTEMNVNMSTPQYTGFNSNEFQRPFVNDFSRPMQKFDVKQSQQSFRNVSRTSNTNNTNGSNSLLNSSSASIHTLVNNNNNNASVYITPDRRNLSRMNNPSINDLISSFHAKTKRK